MYAEKNNLKDAKMLEERERPPKRSWADSWEITLRAWMGIRVATTFYFVFGSGVVTTGRPSSGTFRNCTFFPNIQTISQISPVD